MIAKQKIDEMNTQILLSLGTNLGDKKARLNKAVEYLRETEEFSDIQISSFYETEPLGYKDQDSFLNAVVSAKTSLPLNILLQICKSCEYYIGRIKRKRWTEREIDIDILLYGNKVLENKKLTVPHPRMHERKFVLIPAAEIAGNSHHPIFDKSINELLSDCKDNSSVNLLKN